jgi:predicted ABC-type ATPase
MPQLWVVAGPNGAGKSALVGRYLAGRLPIVNPDTISQELDPANPTRVRIRVRAGREAIRQQEALLAQGADFALETTLAGHRELALLQRARKAGYKVTLVYIGVDSTDVLLGRITQRVTEGGHDVPTEDVDRRYIRSMANLAVALQSVDRAFVLDNTGQRYRLLLALEGDWLKRLSRNLPRWAQDALPSALLQRRGLAR